MDRERFARCAEENIDRIFRVVCSYTENSAAAEDVCRDTLLQLCRTAIAIRGGAIEMQ